MNFPRAAVYRIPALIFSLNRVRFEIGSSAVLICSILLASLCSIYPKACFAGSDPSTQDFVSSPLTFSSAKDVAIEQKKAFLIKTLNGQKKAGRFRLVDDPVYQNRFDGCSFHREETIKYYGQSFGGTDQTTTSEVEITFDVNSLTKIEPSFDVGPPEVFSVLFVSDATTIDVRVDGEVFHHFEQLITVDDAQTAQIIVDAFNFIANSCKAGKPASRK